MKLIDIVMIGNSNYIGTSLNGYIQDFASKGKTLFSFFKNKSDRTSHWFGHYQLKELDVNNFFESKQTIEDMEAVPTKSLLKNFKY